MSGRFRKNDEASHQGAFFELYWHEFLFRSGYLVDVHPVLSGVADRPDFFAKKPGVSPFYFEAKVAMPPLDPACEKRFAVVYDVLNRMDSPSFFLDMEYEGNATDNINGRELAAQLQQWLRTLDPDLVAGRLRRDGYDSLPTHQFSEHGLTLTFFAIPKGPEFRGKRGIPTIGSTMLGELRLLTPHDDIRSGIKKKAKKYGPLDFPLVIAINVMDIFCEHRDVLNGLFGEQQMVVTRQVDGNWSHDWGTRALNGAWHGTQGPRNTKVSAAIVTNALTPWTLRACEVELTHNPWASQPLSSDSLAIPQYFVRKGHLSRSEGTQASNLLGVPNPWPIDE